MRPLAAMPTRVSCGVKSAAMRSRCALLGRVFGVLAGVAEGGVSAGDDALNECGRDGEGGRALGGVEYAEAAAGAGSHVEEAASLLEAGGDGVDGFGDVGEFGGYGGGDCGVFFVDDAEHVEGGELVDVLGGGVAGFGGERGEIHVLHDGGWRVLAAIRGVDCRRGVFA